LTADQWHWFDYWSWICVFAGICLVLSLAVVFGRDLIRRLTHGEPRGFEVKSPTGEAPVMKEKEDDHG
jgi:hypothetical protein